ncbi:unnamed protein product [Arctia plantaginis]|uniref:Uncharacterized protein n=1 Tax=Arctia plantaginis TaxID=874455 RepID=A0A8S1ARN2_ARCPL|nr:unnamed protein product [Arctia plantaginis]
MTSPSFRSRGERAIAPYGVAPNLRLRAFGRIDDREGGRGKCCPNNSEVNRTHPSGYERTRPVASPATRPTVARPLIFCQPPDDYQEN